VQDGEESEVMIIVRNFELKLTANCKIVDRFEKKGSSAMQISARFGTNVIPL
jgi:hypothetical protein